MSPKRPIGIENAAAVSKNAMLTHPSSTALIAKSRPMDGRATFTEDPMNGPRNDVKLATINAARRVVRACFGDWGVRIYRFLKCYINDIDRRCKPNQRHVV